MGIDNETRSSARGEQASGGQGAMVDEGVGGRHQASTPPPGGGGYPDNGAISELPLGAKKNRGADPRLDELRDMGMRPRWIQIAEEIGVDAFLRLWRLLDENPPNMPGSTVYVSMPRFTRYLRYQRNRFIEALVTAGVGSTDIRRKIKSELSEEVSVRHIDRISAKLRKR